MYYLFFFLVVSVHTTFHEPPMSSFGEQYYAVGIEMTTPLGLADRASRVQDRWLYAQTNGFCPNSPAWPAPRGVSNLQGAVPKQTVHPIQVRRTGDWHLHSDNCGEPV